MSGIAVIDMNPPRPAECYACGRETPVGWGLPVWNGLIVGNEWPHEWAGIPACAECYLRHERGELTEVTPEEYVPFDGFECGCG